MMTISARIHLSQSIQEEILKFYVTAECDILPGDSDTSLLSMRLLPGTKWHEASVRVPGYENNDK